MMEFDKKVLIVGYGAVSKCTLPVLFKHIKLNPKKVTIIDIEDKGEYLRDWVSKGVKFFKRKITQENLDEVLSDYLEEGGLMIDLAWNIDCCTLVEWCHDHHVLYINTSIEQWNPEGNLFSATPFEKSLYFRHMKLRKMIANWEKGSTTAVLDHGANPGLISHFTKHALADIAKMLIKDKKVSDKEAKSLNELIKDERFGELSMRLGVKTIHCSERDTQVTNRPKEVDEFVGTWSIEGLREEGTAPAEMGWGTHEKELPKLAVIPPYGPKNQIFLAQMGVNTWVRSWIPHHEIVGMVIRHGEAFGISDKFTVCKDGKPVYRPTVHYAYMPCHETLSSLHELRCRNYEMQPKMRIMGEEITRGEDILGALLMGHAYNSWWCGSILSIEEARKLAPHENATTLQVAISVVAATMWMIENPKKGVNLPDDLPYEHILKIAKPYLGRFVSIPADWTPLKNRKIFFKENPASKPDEDVWQFRNFQFVM